MDEVLISFRKAVSKSVKKYGVNRCMICKKENPKFCNSHTVPRFVLNNIANNGMLKQSIMLMTDISIGVFDEDRGINNTGTFKNICRDCDSRIFSEYENPENLEKLPSQRMLLQIAMKNTLYQISKKYSEKGLNELTIEKFGVKNIAEKHHKIDLREYEQSFNRMYKALCGKKKVEFDLFFWEKLDYVVPIAYQGPITLYSDLNGFIVNDIYDEDYRHFMQDINICIFPLENCSIVMAFNDRSYSNNFNFIKQFREKMLHEKLYIINYILMYYSEDYFLSPCIDESLKENEGLNGLCSDLNLVMGDCYGNINPEERLYKLNLLKHMQDVPNLLDEKYKLR